MIFGRTTAEQIEEDKRWKIRFAYFPRQLDDGRWVWLERYLHRNLYHYERHAERKPIPEQWNT